MTHQEAFRQWMKAFVGWGDERNEEVLVRKADQTQDDGVQRVPAKDKGQARPRDACGSKSAALAIEILDKRKASMIKIESGIPIPVGPTGRRSLYPWEALTVGDSFFVEATEDLPLLKLQNSVFHSISYYRKANKILKAEYGISTRRWPRKQPYGIRVWRLT